MLPNLCSQGGKTSGVWGQRSQEHGATVRREKSQLGHRIEPPLVCEILDLFNAGQMDSATACERLQIGRTQLYRLRTRWLKDKGAFELKLSGGNHKQLWPKSVTEFLEAILPLSKPLNYALIADQLERRFEFKRARSTVAGYIQEHYPHRIAQHPPGPKPRRRWECAAIGELYQHDSSPHQWWPSALKQALILTADDHSRRIVAGRFDADTTWSHFCIIRPCFENHGAPATFYTDGLSLFGHTSTFHREDTCSQFQRALTGLGVNHRVAPSPQAKGKIERLFVTFQKRLVTLFAYEKVRDHDHANQLLPTRTRTLQPKSPAWHDRFDTQSSLGKGDDRRAIQAPTAARRKAAKPALRPAYSAAASARPTPSSFWGVLGRSLPPLTSTSSSSTILKTLLDHHTRKASHRLA
jgi:hypothetical protein